MEIKTSYSVGEHVYFLYENEIVEGVIVSLFVTCERKSISDYSVICSVLYKVDFMSDGAPCKFDEKDLFSSKRELLEYLANGEYEICHWTK